MQRRRVFSPFVALFLAALVTAAAGPVRAEQAAELLRPETVAEMRPDVARLVTLLSLPELFEIMQKEGLSYGADIEAEMFQDQGGAAWADKVAGIYAPAREMPIFIDAFARALEGVDTAPAIAFLESDLGRRAVRLETDARRALLDPANEEAATLRAEEMLAEESPRLALLDDFIAAGDLLEANVAGAMNANLAFYKALRAGGAFPYEMTDADMLADVWSQESDIRTETHDWLVSYLALAYDPLSDDDLRAYTAFSQTPAGRALNRAIFAGFDASFVDVSGALGAAAAYYIAGHDL